MAEPTNVDHKYKIMLIGESSIGKTSFISRYTSNTFKLEYLSTVGIDFQIKNLQLNGKNIRLQIWDTAGQERYRNITKNYFQSSNGFVIAYDITNKKSFDCIINWIEEIDQNAPVESKKILVGTKCDKEGREVTFEEGQELANEHQMKFFETSAKDNTNISETFETLTTEILEGDDGGRRTIVIDKNNNNNTEKDEEEKKKKCCN